jgi:hypothetical protein
LREFHDEGDRMGTLEDTSVGFTAIVGCEIVDRLEKVELLAEETEKRNASLEDLVDYRDGQIAALEKRVEAMEGIWGTLQLGVDTLLDRMVDVEMGVKEVREDARGRWSGTAIEVPDSPLLKSEGSSNGGLGKGSLVLLPEEVPRSELTVEEALEQLRETGEGAGEFVVGGPE